MGRIVTNISIKNILNSKFSLSCDALIDTGAANLVLPTAWKSRLGNLNKIREIDCEIANQQLLKGEICGPVEIKIEGFDPIYGEVLFLEMEPVDGIFEPLIGYIILEQSQAAIDMLGHRLIHIKKVDLKNVAPSSRWEIKTMRK